MQRQLQSIATNAAANPYGNDRFPQPFRQPPPAYEPFRTLGPIPMPGAFPQTPAAPYFPLPPSQAVAHSTPQPEFASPPASEDATDNANDNTLPQQPIPAYLTSHKRFMGHLQHIKLQANGSKKARRAPKPVPKHAEAKLALKNIPREHRLFFLDAVDSWKATNTGKGDEKAIAFIIERLKRTDAALANKFGTAKRGTLYYWRKEAQREKELRRYNSSTAGKLGKRQLDELDALITSVLQSMVAEGTLWTIEIACQYIAGTKEFEDFKKKNPKVTLHRSKVYSLMKACKCTFQIPRVDAMTDNELTEAARVIVLELATVCANWTVKKEDIYSLDESSARLFPKPTKIWCTQNSCRRAAIRATKAFTTVMGGISMDGRVLKFMVNFKGETNRSLAWGGFPDDAPTDMGDHAIQYLNREKHWSTTDSLMYYIEHVVVPDWRSRKSPTPFVILWDHAPSHDGYECRHRFEDRFGRIGILLFIPRNGTSAIQPMDIGVFGVFKPIVRQYQNTAVCTGLMEHRFTAWRLQLVKQILMRAVMEGVKGIKKAIADSRAAADRDARIKNEPRRMDLVQRAWQVLEPALSPEWLRVALQESKDDATIAKNKLFEYGIPQKECFERSRYYRGRLSAKVSRNDLLEEESGDEDFELCEDELDNLSDPEDT